MPNIKSAKKKLKQDVKREKANAAYKKSVKKTVKNIGKMKDIKKAYATIDKAAKKGVVHKNKAARLKSKVSKLLAKKK